MKNILKLIVLLVLFAFASCKENKSNGSNTGEIPNQNSEEQLYSCPMHPEINGQKGESCSVCGMELTEKL